MRKAILALALAAGAGPVAGQDASLGATLFAARCAACHGAEAKGDGPMAQLLTVPVPDLTQLALRNGGMFPRAEAALIIDGTRTLGAHGGPMPVYGRMLGGGSAVIDGPEGSVVETSVEVISIVFHLESLQAE